MSCLFLCGERQFTNYCTVVMFGTLEMKDVLPTCPFCYIAIEDNLPTCPIFWSIAKKDFFTNLSCLVLGSENSELLKNVQLFMNPKFSVFKPSLPLSSTVYLQTLEHSQLAKIQVLSTPYVQGNSL